MLLSLTKRGDKTCSPAHLPSKHMGIPHPPVLGSLGLPSHEGRGRERHARPAKMVPLGDVRSSPPATVTQVQAQAGAELRAGQESANPGPGHMWPIAHELRALDILNLYNKIEKKLTENKALCRKRFPGPSSRADRRDSHRVLSETDGLCVVG